MKAKTLCSTFVKDPNAKPLQATPTVTQTSEGLGPSAILQRTFDSAAQMATAVQGTAETRDASAVAGAAVGSPEEKVRLNFLSTAAIAVVAGLAITGSVMVTPPASATEPADAPPGYGGPVSNCPGSRVRDFDPDFYLLSSSGDWRSGVLEVWYSSGNSGTYCAFTRDNIAGSHHMEVVIRRGDWTTSWYDSGTYKYYAGGVEVFGAAAKTVYLFGRVTVNGVNYEARVRCDPTAVCHRIDGW